MFVRCSWAPRRAVSREMNFLHHASTRPRASQAGTDGQAARPGAVAADRGHRRVRDAHGGCALRATIPCCAALHPAPALPRLAASSRTAVCCPLTPCAPGRHGGLRASLSHPRHALITWRGPGSRARARTITTDASGSGKSSVPASCMCSTVLLRALRGVRSC